MTPVSSQNYKWTTKKLSINLCVSGVRNVSFSKYFADILN